VGCTNSITPSNKSRFAAESRLRTPHALLADSPDEAKALAEAEVRGRGEFEAIQDSWPEEVVSVEAVAVEPYPDLE
jgi:hypothetical protein